MKRRLRLLAVVVACLFALSPAAFAVNTDDPGGDGDGSINPGPHDGGFSPLSNGSGVLPRPVFTSPIDAYGSKPPWVCDPTVKPGTAALVGLLHDFSGVGSGGLTRACNADFGATFSLHKMGMALDWSVDVAVASEWTKGNQVLAWLFEADSAGNRHARIRRLGITQIIWNNRIWQSFESNDVPLGPNTLTWDVFAKSSASRTWKHLDHMHISLSQAGALKQTSWWTGAAATDLKWFLRNSNSNGPTDAEFFYGLPTDLRVSGDWNGDGIDTPGVFRAGRWFLRNANTTGGGDVDFWFGQAGDVPVVGDWNSDGIDTIGVFRAGQWFVRNSNSSGAADATFGFGDAGDQPVTGDWNGDLVDTIGVFRAGQWFLRDLLSTGPANYNFWFGDAGDVPVVGDWNNNGVDTIGVFRAGQWFLRNSNSNGAVDVSFWFGASGDKPLAGDWNNDGIDTIGTTRGV